jgi:hypothetical protein
MRYLFGDYGTPSMLRMTRRPANSRAICWRSRWVRRGIVECYTAGRAIVTADHRAVTLLDKATRGRAHHAGA